MEPELNCTIIGFEELHRNTTMLRSCTDRKRAINALKVFEKSSIVFLKNQNIPQCPMSCFQIGFVATLNYFHINSMLNPRLSEAIDVSDFDLLVNYETFQIEDTVESLIYDFSSFVSAVGGNLGLFLGLSLFSVYGIFVQIIKDKTLF